MKQHTFLGIENRDKRVDLIRYKKGNRYAIRRSVAYLVAEAFVKNPNNYRYIMFKDGDYSNCQSNNLKWIKKKDYIPPYELNPNERVLPPYS